MPRPGREFCLLAGRTGLHPELTEGVSMRVKARFRAGGDAKLHYRIRPARAQSPRNSRCHRSQSSLTVTVSRARLIGSRNSPASVTAKP